MKEQNKTSEKQLNKTEITNLLDSEFKTVVIGMLKELIEYVNNIKKTQEAVKITLNEIRKINREPIVEGMMPGFKSMIWNIRKK